MYDIKSKACGATISSSRDDYKWWKCHNNVDKQKTKYRKEDCWLAWTTCVLVIISWNDPMGQLCFVKIPNIHVVMLMPWRLSKVLPKLEAPEPGTWIFLFCYKIERNWLLEFCKFLRGFKPCVSLFTLLKFTLQAKLENAKPHHRDSNQGPSANHCAMV